VFRLKLGFVLGVVGSGILGLEGYAVGVAPCAVGVEAQVEVVLVITDELDFEFFCGEGFVAMVLFESLQPLVFSFFGFQSLTFFLVLF
jgi:hypothetical protein